MQNRGRGRPRGSARGGRRLRSYAHPTTTEETSVSDHTSMVSLPTTDEEENISYTPLPITDAFVPTSRCFSVGSSLNLTELARKHHQQVEEDPEEEADSGLDPRFQIVGDHRVKTEHAPLLRSIFHKHGDITLGTEIRSREFVSIHLERICVIFNRLKDSKFLRVTTIELQEMLLEVEDIQRQKINVGWLGEKLASVMEARIGWEKYWGIKEEQDRREKEIESLQAKIGELQVKNLEMKKVEDEVRRRIVYHSTHSLVHGLL